MTGQAGACERTDAEIIGRARSRPDEFAAVFDRHFVTVHRYLSRRVGSAVADDLASETFTIALTRLGRYDESQRSARPWLLGIATNLVHRHRRDEMRLLHALQRSAAAALDNQIDDFAVRVSAQVSAESTAAPLLAALTTLAAADRDVVLLYAWGQLTYDEIATSLSIPIGTVRSRLHRSRAQLRRAVEGSTSHQTLEEICHD